MKQTLQPVAVVDTNVLLDVYSCHDLSGVYDRVRQRADEDPDAIYRRARARESLLLAMHFHATEAATYSLVPEGLQQMQKCSALTILIDTFLDQGRFQSTSVLDGAVCGHKRAPESRFAREMASNVVECANARLRASREGVNPCGSREGHHFPSQGGRHECISQRMGRAG